MPCCAYVISTARYSTKEHSTHDITVIVKFLCSHKSLYRDSEQAWLCKQVLAVNERPYNVNTSRVVKRMMIQ